MGVGRNDTVARVLTVSSSQRVLTIVGGTLLQRKCRIATLRSPLRLRRSGLNECRLVLLSIVVPNVSKFSLYHEVHRGISYPVLFLATGARRGSMVAKLNTNKSSCVAGPFKVKRLQTEITTRVQQRGERGARAVYVKRIHFSVRREGVCIRRRRLIFAGTRCAVYRFLTLGRKRMFSGRQVLRRMFKFSKSDGDSTVARRMGGVHTGFRGFKVGPVRAI